jgi:demethylmenaquinone methyltransferase/2-methoxy-6-polyprenyl-1,4-benzoquinol methylase
MTTELNKDGKRIRAMFSGIAPWYDFLNHFLSLNIDRYWRNRMTKLVPPEGNDPILDVCTGTGDLALAYHAASKGKIKIVGSDFCLPMLESAYKKNRKRGLGIFFLEADTLCLPFSENHFQLTTVAFGIRNVSDTEAGISEMIRVTKPGGRVAILEFSRPKGWFLGNLYLFYFQRMLPLLGQLFSKSKDDAYHYLRNSVLQFPDGEQFAQKMRDQGLLHVTWKPFTFGIATLYWGTKSAPT